MNISAEVKRLAFENIGQGFTVAAGWFHLDGKAHWVDFTATRTGTGRRRAAWTVSATMHRKEGSNRRAQVTLRNCYRYEAVQAAVDALNGYPLACQGEC